MYDDAPPRRANNSTAQHVQDLRAAPDHPGSRRVTLTPQIPNKSFSVSPFRNYSVPKCVTYSAIVPAGVEDTFHADFNVEFWYVAIIAAAGVRCNVVAAPSAAGPAWIFGGGGHARIPGADSPDLAFRNTGANPLTIIAIATVGYPDLDYDPGDLA